MMNADVVNAVVLGKNPMPGDYRRSVAQHTMNSLSSGKLVPNGDKGKAMKALYGVVFGKGAGAGCEVERFLPLGTDMAARVQGYLSHGLDVFGDVANDISIAR